jgi:hypothetical protein
MTPTEFIAQAEAAIEKALGVPVPVAEDVVVEVPAPKTPATEQAGQPSMVDTNMEAARIGLAKEAEAEKAKQ